MIGRASRATASDAEFEELSWPPDVTPPENAGHGDGDRPHVVVHERPAQASALQSATADVAGPRN